MAITIHDTPVNYTPSGNPVVWTFSSDQTAQANFSYLVEVYVGGTIRGRQQIFPGNGIYGRIDVSAYAERFTFPPTLSTSFVVDAANHNEVYITIIERYGDPIADGATLTSSIYNVFKSKQTDTDFINWDPNVYVMQPFAPPSGVSWLTNFPSSSSEYYKIGEAETARVMGISNTRTNNVIIETYDENLTPIGGGTFAVLSANILIFNVSQASIIAGTTITAGDLANASYFSLRMEDTVATVTSNYIYFEIDRECKKDSAKRVHFLSTLGSMESFTYRLFSNQRGRISGATYEREFGSWNGSSYEFNLNKGQTVDYLKTLNKDLLLRSDWLSQEIQNWLENELGPSPLVYIEDRDDTPLKLRRVASKKSTFTLKTTRQDTLFREDLTVILERFSSTAV